MKNYEVIARTGTVICGLVSSLYLLARDHDREQALKELLARDGISLEALADPRNRFPLKVVMEMWEQLRLAMPGFPVALMAGARCKPGTFGALDYLIRNRLQLRLAIRTLCHYHRLVNDSVFWEMSEPPDGSGCVTYSFPSDSLGYSQFGSETLFACIVSVGRHRTGVRWAPARVEFQHFADGDSGIYRTFFGCPVGFGAAKNQMLLARETLDLNFQQSDPALESLLALSVEDDWRQIPRGTSVANRVFRRIELELRQGRAMKLTECARFFKCGPRFLQRKLSEESATFSLLLDQARREACASYLTEGGKRVSEISDLLGFSEPSAFIRAFHRWHGMTPREFQQRTLQS